MSIKLNQHQQIPITYIRNAYGLILFHSTGSGKTITSLKMAEQFKSHKLLIITTKSSIKAFQDDLIKIKWNIQSRPIEFYTYKKFVSAYTRDITLASNKFVIIDEAHRLRNESRDMSLIISAVGSAYKLVLLTATPIINYPSDIAPLINMIKRQEVLPTNTQLFNFYYLDDQNSSDSLELTNKSILQSKMLCALSYYENVSNGNFPQVLVTVIPVEMDPAQIIEYKKYVGQIILEKKIINVDTDVRLTDLEVNYRLLDKKKKNSFLSATRQLSNAVQKQIPSSKTNKLISTLLSNPFPALVYSNYLDFGVFPIAKELETQGISYKIISGSTSESKLDKIINLYNQGQIKVLLITSTGSESLDLKCTRQVHIMEPHWNDAKIRQVIGRASRYNSHSSIPLNQRIVQVYKWISIFPPYINYKTADEYLQDLSTKKDIMFQEIKKILIQASIENAPNC
jgi:superfamily II DNA or RNA helicase